MGWGLIFKEGCIFETYGKYIQFPFWVNTSILSTIIRALTWEIATERKVFKRFDFYRYMIFHDRS